MANNDLSNTENILIKTDENNLIYVDPNSVLVNNEVQPRSVSQEKLVMYANLEADIIPRTTLAADGNTESKSSLRSIAKGVFNFLSSQVGESTNPKDRNFTTDWTDAYLEKTQVKNKDGQIVDEYYQNDGTGQSFGIQNISIQVKGANFIPQVSIDFVDVRGKTLFESPSNSPYKAFFHIPWPIFYLTIKGYYGKAIRYRLHLVSFSSRFNQSTGNFEISTKFVGSTYAYMNDIPLKAILNAPYMFIRTVEGSQSFNEQTGLFEKKALKSSKGYQILKSVYSEMKQKKLIPDDFPVKTLREVCALASTLDKRLEQQIFSEVIDPEVLDGLRKYRETLKNFEVATNGWKNKNLDLTLYNDFTIDSELTRGYALKSKEKDSLKLVTGSTDNHTLEYIVTRYSDELKKHQEDFNKKRKERGVNVNTKILSNSLPPIGNYFTKSPSNNSVYFILHDKIMSDINDIKKVFLEQNTKIEKEIEKKMNEFIKDPTKGLGFEPTVRNLFGILLANAEVYVRLMKDVHNDAFNLANERKTLIGNFSDESVGESIYPWPEIKKNVPGEKQRVIAYPGEPELQDKLRSFDGTLWPEVSFIEEFMGISTNVKDPLVEKEGGVNDLQYIFPDNNKEQSNIKEISSLFQTQQTIPYSNRTPVSFIYEIYERAKQMTLVDSFNSDVLRELANIEFESIQEVVSEELDIVDFLKTQIKSKDDLVTKMQSLSPYERYKYFEDSLPTTNYIKDVITKPYRIEQYREDLKNKNFDYSLYEKLDNFLINYTPESYRKNIFPFNSTTYLSYIDKEKFTDDEFKFKGVFRVAKENEFISTPIDRYNWISPPYYDLSKSFNLLTRPLFNGNNGTNILNTPYFHKQLYNDFNKTTSFAKYAGSAYLLLNSLPYYDLKDYIEFTRFENSTKISLPKIRLSSIFREIGGTHYVPYHLIVKWGSIYHRYKRKVLDGVDILTGFTTSNTDTTTTNINTNLFFNNNETNPEFLTFGDVTYSDGVDVGIHPYYDAIFHQVVNGYNHYVVSSGNTSFSGNTNTGTINLRNRTKENGLNYWTQYVDNSKFDSNDLRYTLLPCDGGNKDINLKIIPNGLEPSDFDFAKSEQMNFRVLWEDEYLEESFSGKTFTSPMEYNMGTGSTRFEITSNQEKVYDLIATFSPEILDEFEDIFLQFSSEYVETEYTYKRFENVKHDNFQQLLKEIVSVEKKTDDLTSTEDTINKIKERQTLKLQQLSEKISENGNLLKLTLGNPKELDPYVLEGYINQTESFGIYDLSSQSGNTKYITLYVGENPDTGISYQNFFQISNISLTEENVLLFRPLILIYGGYIKNGGTNTRVSFSDYLKTNILDKATTTISVGGSNNRLDQYLIQLISKFSSLKIETNNESINFVDGYNNRQIKVELYNTFKSFNDKWVAGNSLGQRLLFEEFLFLDRANRDIGSKAYLNISKFVNLVDNKNDKANLYTTISMLLQDTGFDMRALPAYVNFYGTNISNRSKITPSKKVAENLFGTFLDVDYEESSPKIVVQFVGPTSKRPADMDKSVNKFNDDSFDISNRNNNPLIVTLPELYDVDQLNKSNKVVAFEVSFGDQYQNIFKGVTLDQATLRNTSESFVVLENLARSESGSGAYNVDISLFDYYKQASYSCEVSMMGNVMIQPTMYFYLKNIPMFRGTYWITEVSHSIRGNNIETTFKGTRIPVAALPDPEDSFVSSYKALLDKIINAAKTIVKKNDNGETTTEQTISTPSGNFTIDLGGVQIKGEEVLPNVGISEFGIPFNGYGNEKYIQKVKYQQQNGQVGEWFRAKVVRMGMESKIYELSDATHMSLLSRLQNSVNVNSEGETGLKWLELKSLANSHNFYSTKFQFTKSITADKIITGTTIFLNPNNNKQITVSPKFDLDRRIQALDVSGPVNIGPSVSGYGIALSNKLMKDLNIVEGEIVYFKIN